MAGKIEIKEGYLYTKDHEWLHTEQDGNSKIGISAHAVDQLGDVTLVNLDVKVGDEIAVGKSFGTVESVKTLSDLYAPVSGTVTAINETLTDAPELVNNEPYDGGWIVEIKTSTEPSGLMDATAYRSFLEGLDH
jgi:glycine cleavage system H protein